MMTSLLFLHSVHVQNHSIDLLRLAIADVCYETARAPFSSEPSIRSSMGSAHDIATRRIGQIERALLRVPFQLPKFCALWCPVKRAFHISFNFSKSKPNFMILNISPERSCNTLLEYVEKRKTIFYDIIGQNALSIAQRRINCVSNVKKV